MQPHNSYMSLCQKVLGEDHPFFGRKCFFRFKFSLNKPNFIRKSMHQRDNKDKLDSQSQFWVSKIWKFTPSPGRKSAKDGWTFWVHRFSCRFVCIFLLQVIFLLLPDRTYVYVYFDRNALGPVPMLTKTFVCYYSLRTCGWWNKEAVAKISV